MRHFYTDALAAAWMAKHFGMQFVYANENSICTAETVRDDCQLPEYDGVHYIHHDSVHLLEPRIGDLCDCDYGCIDYAVAGINNPISLFVFYYDYEQKPTKIIQRNGIPFMWPEQDLVQERADLMGVELE